MFYSNEMALEEPDFGTEIDNQMVAETQNEEEGLNLINIAFLRNKYITYIDYCRNNEKVPLLHSERNQWHPQTKKMLF